MTADDEQAVHPGLVLDCRGQRCPLPVIALARRITDVGIGAVVRVEADDPAAGNDVPAWCRMRAHTFLGAEPASDGVPGLLVRRDH